VTINNNNKNYKKRRSVLNWMEGAREEEKTDMVRFSIWDKNTEGHTI
jgi:hypothetical protein